MTLATSHGKVRVERPRLRELSALPTAPDRPPQRDANGRWIPGSAGAAGRHGKRAAAAGLRRAFERAVARAVEGNADPEQARLLLGDALAAYNAQRREIGATSPIVLASLRQWAVSTVAADYLSAEALIVGLATKRGLELSGMAERLAARAERSSTHALDVHGVLRRALAATDRPAPWMEAPK